jgi:phage-related protein
MQTKQIAKTLYWVAGSKKDLLAMPKAIASAFGYGLHQAQIGSQHVSAKVLKGFGGAGVLELIESDEGGTYRAVYTARIGESIYVLHCFQKKSKQGIKTPLEDMNLIRSRLKIAEQMEQGKQL